MKHFGVDKLCNCCLALLLKLCYKISLLGELRNIHVKIHQSISQTSRAKFVKYNQHIFHVLHPKLFLC